MGRFVQSAGFGMGVTSALILAYLFFVVKNIPSPPEMRNMSDKELFYIYHSYLDNTDYHCRRKLRMGHAGDGGWEVCDDLRYRPIKPCIVYSFGINYDFSFDDDVSKIYGCVVHSFDPSMNQQSHQRLTQGWFYNLGIGGEDGRLPTEGVGSRGHKNWSVKTLAEIMAMLRHQNLHLSFTSQNIGDLYKGPSLNNDPPSGVLLPSCGLRTTFATVSSQRMTGSEADKLGRPPGGLTKHGLLPASLSSLWDGQHHFPALGQDKSSHCVLHTMQRQTLATLQESVLVAVAAR
ncbi:hypothetical protein ACOMHN_030736 [Nucella lapillus]